MSPCHTWYFKMSYQWCKLFLNTSENDIWEKITDKALNLRDRNKSQRDLGKFETLEESTCAKNLKGSPQIHRLCGVLEDNRGIKCSTNVETQVELGLAWIRAGYYCPVGHNLWSGTSSTAQRGLGWAREALAGPDPGLILIWLWASPFPYGGHLWCVSAEWLSF